MKETIYLSAHLKSTDYGKPVYDQLKEILESRGYKIKDIERHSKNEWCRDYMPVKGAEGRLVKFTYAPIYLTEAKKWEKTIPKVNLILQDLGIKVESESALKLDGGAIEVYGDQAIVSDRVLRDNYPLSYEDIIKDLNKKLGLKRLIFVPEYPDDFTGHVDGIVRFIDNNTVLINEEIPATPQDIPNYYKRKMHNNWYYSFLMTFKNLGIKVKTIPITFYDNNKEKNLLGLYINFLKLDELIIMPSYETNEDDKAAGILEDIYQRPVIRINSRELAKRDGMINCVTWQKD